MAERRSCARGARTRSPANWARLRRRAVVSLLAIEATGVSAATLTPYATAGVEQDTNVFEIPKGDVPLLGYGPEPGDTISDYRAGLIGAFLWSTNSLAFTAEGRRYLYHRFSFLDHTEYLLDTELDWHFGPTVETLVTANRHRYMAPFAYTLSTQLEVNTETVADVTTRILLSPKWRLDLTPRYHALDSPLPDFPDFRLRETTGSMAIDYLGVSKVTAGLEADYTEGAYSGIVEATQYHQVSSELTVRYKVTGLSSFSGNLGYTVRNATYNAAGTVQASPQSYLLAETSGSIGRFPSVTGSIAYEREVTGKTNLTLTLYRNITSYVAGANSEIGTGGDLALTWNPDVRFTFGLEYQQEHDSVAGNVVVANAANLEQMSRTGKVFVKYYPFSWLTVRLHAERTDRTANIEILNYTETIAGIDLTAHFGGEPGVQPTAPAPGN